MNQYGVIRQNETFGSDFVSNGAITCLSNIIHDNADHTWTIISANDETQMGLDHGYHTEMISFLRQMEYLTKDTTITIPTASVYFFVEKVPLNYAVPYVKSGQSISKAGALQALPNVGGIGMYQGENRWILMSRMYYWAQAFEKLYPDAMSVYYESDQFICYKLDQNMYHLYNLAIDYGYNQIVDEQMEQENGFKKKFCQHCDYYGCAFVSFSVFYGDKRQSEPIRCKYRLYAKTAGWDQCMEWGNNEHGFTDGRKPGLCIVFGNCGRRDALAGKQLVQLYKA